MQIIEYDSSLPGKLLYRPPSLGCYFRNDPTSKTDTYPKSNLLHCQSHNWIDPFFALIAHKDCFGTIFSTPYYFIIASIQFGTVCPFRDEEQVISIFGLDGT